MDENGTASPGPGKPPWFLKVREFADLIRVHRSTVYRDVKKGEVPFIRRTPRSQILINATAALAKYGFDSSVLAEGRAL